MSVSAGEIDVVEVAGRALAAAPRDEAIELAPGDYTVVLAPDAVGELLEFLDEMSQTVGNRSICAWAALW